MLGVERAWRGYFEGGGGGESMTQEKFSRRLREIMPNIEKVGPKKSQTTIDPNNNDLL